MVGEQMPLFDPAFLLLGQLPKHFTQVLAKAAIQHFPSALRYKYNVVLALPLRVA
jgi:hypothetical protein